MSAEQATCTRCATERPISAFRKTAHGHRNACKSCDRKGARQRELASPDARRVWQRRFGEKLRLQRKNPTLAGKFIFMDSRASDRKAGRDNDLNRLFVETAIANGCLYCGERELRMTLDRIDNALGHLMANVVPACIRCNYVRRDMPYAAWMTIAPSMRVAREAGLFRGWNNRVR